MTLIARVKVGDVALYFADMLVSSARATGQKIDIPSIEDVNSHFPSTFHEVSGLRQKLNVLNDRLLAAWAGSALQARSILRRIADVENATLYDVVGIIRDTPEADRDNLSLMFAYSEPQARGAFVSHLDYAVEKYELSAAAQISVAGSGEKFFTKLLPQLFSLNPPPATGDASELYEWADQFGLTLAANHMGFEKLTGQNLLEFWGGGFEVATFQASDKFEKLDDMLFTFWTTSPSSDEVVSIYALPSVIKYNYYDDVLVVRAIDCEIAPDGNGLKITRDTQNTYFPLLKGPNAYPSSQFPKPSLDHSILCCCLIPSDKGLIGTSVYLDDSKETPFKLTVNEHKIGFSFRRALIEEIEARTTKMLGVRAEFKGLGVGLC